MTKSKAIIAIVAAFASVASTAPADAAGCIKGAIVGGVAGHYAGHGVLGAVGGCVVGRRLAKDKAAREREAQQLQQKAPVAYDGSSSRDPKFRQIPGDARYSGVTASTQQGDGSNVGSLYNGGAYRR